MKSRRQWPANAPSFGPSIYIYMTQFEIYQKYFLKIKNIYYFDAFPSKKYFEKQPLLYS
jgi:hypothetical protein